MACTTAVSTIWSTCSCVYVTISFILLFLSLLALAASHTESAVVAAFLWGLQKLAALAAEKTGFHLRFRFLKPPNFPFFFGCVMWITRIASLAKP